MKRVFTVAALAAGSLSFALSVAQAADKGAPHHWGYEGEMNPARWGNEFPTCGLGKSQSPVDIKGPFVKATQALTPDYREGALKIVNNGHTIQLNVAPGSTLKLGSASFDLVQFHFHRPSEHTIDGKPTRTYFHWLALTYAMTLTGHPSTSIPCGKEPTGTPFGLMVTGPHRSDRFTLECAHALEQLFARDPVMARPIPDIKKLSRR